MHLSPQAPLIHKTPQAKLFDSIYEHKFINKSLYATFQKNQRLAAQFRWGKKLEEED